MSIYVFCPFFFIELFAFLLVSCSSSLYVLNASLLSEICIVNTFSQAVVCLFRAGGFNPDKISFLWCAGLPSPSLLLGFPWLTSIFFFPALQISLSCSSLQFCIKPFSGFLKKRKRETHRETERQTALFAKTSFYSSNSSLPFSFPAHNFFIPGT